MKGDLAAAQQVLAALWVAVSEARLALDAGESEAKVAAVLAGAQKECAELFAKAFGD